MKNRHLISSWREWVELCSYWDEDPYKTVEFGKDKGGGDSFTWEYTGDVPKKEDE